MMSLYKADVLEFFCPKCMGKIQNNFVNYKNNSAVCYHCNTHLSVDISKTNNGNMNKVFDLYEQKED